MSHKNGAITYGFGRKITQSEISKMARERAIEVLAMSESGLSHDEIGQHIGVSKGRVRQIIAMGKRVLAHRAATAVRKEA